MKKLLLILLAGSCCLLWAQTNQPAQKKPPATPTDITSDSADFDLTGKRVEYLGHVLVKDSQINLQCDRLVVDLPESGQRPSRISAESDSRVLIDLIQNSQKYHVTATNALYQYSVENSVTNDTVTLTGSPVAQSGENVIQGDKIIWDRVTGHFRVFNQHGTLQSPEDGKTNGLPLKLF